VDIPDVVRQLHAGEPLRTPRSRHDGAAVALPGEVAAHFEAPPAAARFGGMPPWLHPSLVGMLAARGIQELYSHQALAANHIHEGRHTVVATPTASGKSLCYQLPVLDGLLRRGDRCRALFLYPTKALARDQMADLESMLATLDGPAKEAVVAVYDGDTPPAVRSALREKGNLLLTNPHMLHVGILPNHTKWQGLFSNLDYVVVDEVHTLSGIYGSHVANVLRRLKRICRHYGSDPVFCAASATISNPGEHARRLFEEDVAVVDEDGSARGPKHWIFFNPALVSQASGMRIPALEAARQLAGDLLTLGNLQTVSFARSRSSVEVLLKYLRDEARVRGVDQERIAGYRGGYLPLLRRSIEEGLRSGKVTSVVATNALELGVDIGSLDVCIMVGYAGTVSSTFQRAGRVGRRGRASAVVFVGRSFAMDQFLMHNPGFLFDAPREAVSIDPDNPVILMNHVKCAVFELPMDRSERFGGAEGVPDVLEFLTRDLRLLVEQNGRYHYADDTYPADGVSLTAADMDNVVIRDQDNGVVLAEIDRASAIVEVYEGAIYGHQGEQYQVERFDYENRRAFVRKVEVDYYTQADTDTEVRLLHIDDTVEFPLYEAHHAEVHIATLAKAFKKIRYYTRENVGIGEIHLPPEEFETEACILALSLDLAHKLELDAGAGAASLHGVGELIQGLVPLFVRVDPGDVKVHSETRHPHFERPTLTIYDRIPDGVGLSERIFKVHREVLRAALGVVDRCSCATGCPACVGPGAAAGRRAKGLARTVLTDMLGPD